MQYDMKGVLQQCVDKYQELAGAKAWKLKKVATLFCSEAQLEPLYDIEGEC